MENITLSVVFITYNHEPYLQQALESVLMQETDFAFEIVVGEDCSTDRTREILLAYKEKYPDKFRLLFREKNFGRPTQNVYETAMACRGDYLAFLEGDDYWTDPHKLQRQVDFLRGNPDYMGVTHTCRVVGQEGGEVFDVEALSLYEWSGDYTFRDFQTQTKWPGQTATVVCRNIFREGKYDYSILYKAHDFLDDGVILMFLLLQGKIFRMDAVMSAWRFVKKAGAGNWNSLKLKRNAMVEDCYTKQKLLMWCEENFGLSDYGKELAQKDFTTALSVFLKKPSAETLRFVKDIYGYNIGHVVKQDRRSSLLAYSAAVIVRTLWKKGKQRQKGSET